MKLDKKQIIIYSVIAIVIMLIIIMYLIIKINPEESSSSSNLEIVNNTVQNEVVEAENQQKIKVHIAGSVVTEGIVELEEGARIADAISAAGGTTADANMKNVNLAYKVNDGEKIYIPSELDDETTPVLENNNGNGSSLINKTGKTNINTATQTELELLSGIGPSTASKIIDYRTKNGNFKQIEDIKEVPGIGESKFAQIQDNITV